MTWLSSCLHCPTMVSQCMSKSPLDDLYSHLADLGYQGQLVSQVLDNLAHAQPNSNFIFPGTLHIGPPTAGTRKVSQAEQSLIEDFNVPLRTLDGVDELPIMKKDDSRRAFEAWEARCLATNILYWMNTSTAIDRVSVGNVWIRIGIAICQLFEASGVFDELPKHRGQGQ